MANGWGGPRPKFAGSRPRCSTKIILRETQPGRFEQIAQATPADLTPLAVMHDNMRFFRTKARELLAAIMAVPLGADADTSGSRR